MKAKFVVVKGAKPVDIPLRLPAVIGRSREAALKVRTTVVSRKHCEVYEDGGQLFVRDMGSANGTFVNNVRIDEDTQLASGDLLSVGPVTLRTILEQPVKQIPDESDSVVNLAEGVVAAEEESGLSMVQYQETAEGSFIGIEDVDDGEPFAEPVDEQAVEAPEVAKTEPDEPGLSAEPEIAQEVIEVAEHSPAAKKPIEKPAVPQVPTKQSPAAKSDSPPTPKSPVAPKDKKQAAKTGKEATKKTAVSKEAKEAIEALGGAEEDQAEQVDNGDAALNDFFKNIG